MRKQSCADGTVSIDPRGIARQVNEHVTGLSTFPKAELRVRVFPTRSLLLRGAPQQCYVFQGRPLRLVGGVLAPRRPNPSSYQPTARRAIRRNSLTAETGTFRIAGQKT
jgi:hypothetical protein